MAIVIKANNDWRGVGRPKVVTFPIFNECLCLYIQASDCRRIQCSSAVGELSAFVAKFVLRHIIVLRLMLGLLNCSYIRLINK